MLSEYFPHQKMRESQKHILSEIEYALKVGYKYILLNAGTGIGKSAIAITLARYYNSAYIITATKQLQKQYIKDFNYPRSIGRGNFKCKTIGTTCDKGYCRITTDKEKEECKSGVILEKQANKAEFISSLGLEKAFKDNKGRNWVYKDVNNQCDYWEQKANAINSKITILNFSNHFLELNYLPFFPKKKLTIFDEAHNLESHLMGQINLKLNNKKLRDELNFEEREIENTTTYQLTEKDFKNSGLNYWIQIIDKLKEEYRRIRDKNPPEERMEKILKTLNKLKMIYRGLFEEPERWIIIPNEEYQSIEFKLIEASKECKKYLFNHSKIYLLMSATMPPKNLFCKWHGLEPEDVYEINCKSPFDIRRRPIKIITKGRLNTKEEKETWPKLIPVIKNILKTHSNDKGIIHPQSHQRTNDLFSDLKDSRLIQFSENHDAISKREYIINKFIKSDKPLVLVAPSIKEGIDLPDDLCRFNIILKIPFPNFGDKQIKKRTKLDPEWYAFNTVKDLEQAYGRGMRHNEDRCITYIVDGSIESILTNPKYSIFVSDYFWEALPDNRERKMDEYLKSKGVKT